jgi:hypothetical protein
VGAGIISMMNGNTQRMLKLSAWQLGIYRGCWNYQHDDWIYIDGAGIISMTTGNTQRLLELSA